MALKSQVHTSVEDTDGLDDVENSLLYYNQAIIHYHLRQYSEAISIGEKLIPVSGTRFAQVVCFLLVDLYLLTFQPEKALHLLALLDNSPCKATRRTAKGEVWGFIAGTSNNSNKDGQQKADLMAMIEAAKSQIHQYKVRAYIQMKSSKACKREIKSVMNTAGNSAPSLFLKSNFEYLRGNYRKAVKLLNSSNIAEHPGPIKTGECVRCMFWNNLGCIHFAMGKHNLGKFAGIPMCALLANKRYELLYNCGIQLLHIGRPLAAFECLMEAVQVYHANPRLWLRLAECCIAANKGGSEQESKGLPCKKGIVQSIVGQGYHRKIVLASQSTQNTMYSEGQSAAIPVASMEFAAICLRNALLLLPENPPQDGKAENGSKNSSGQSGSTESGSENSDACRFLGHLYAAEALISLDRISEAIGHLNPENVTDVSLGVLTSDQDQGSDKGDEPIESSRQAPLCYPSSVTSARATMLFNLGSAYCLRSEYEKARKCNTQLALQIIKRNQLLPTSLQTASPDTRKKTVQSFQSSQPMQPIQMPSSSSSSSFTQPFQSQGMHSGGRCSSSRRQQVSIWLEVTLGSLERPRSDRPSRHSATATQTCQLCSLLFALAELSGLERVALQERLQPGRVTVGGEDEVAHLVEARRGAVAAATAAAEEEHK
ncbi:hypothetical protein CRUP_021385 [Coryphaenoides rupestris]|nr:hypothetical protein CRUP_021385 [Coryphaenoides rupestris]